MIDSPSKFALGTFASEQTGAFAALVVDDAVTPLASLGGLAQDTLALLGKWEASLPTLRQLASRIREGADDIVSIPMAQLTVLPPLNPRQIFGIGANYRKFARRLALLELQSAGQEGEASLEARADALAEDRAYNAPVWFSKLPSAVAGAYDPLKLSSARTHWECELAVVIGKGGQNISAGDARTHIAGYAIVNDINDLRGFGTVNGRPAVLDWMLMKSQPGFAPLGPIMVPAEFIPDPYALDIKLSVNGETMQHDLVADMLLPIEEQIAQLSRRHMLFPGDVICTGSPNGNGALEGRFLRPGDIMEATITGLGTQRVRCVEAGAT